MLVTRSGRKASQNEYELRSLIGLLVDSGTTRYCEIGARHGDTFHEIMLALPAGSVGVAVDLPGALWGKSTSRASLKDAVADLNARGYQCSAVFGDSTTEATQRIVKGRGPYDAILIDGDHTLAGVTKDWLAYKDCAPLVAFHDIVGTGQMERVTQQQVEVPVFWESIKHGMEHCEFVDSGSMMGIGVVWTK
jgi:hypothetical protein